MIEETAKIKAVALEITNAAMYALSHDQTRAELQEEFNRIYTKHDLWYFGKLTDITKETEPKAAFECLEFNAKFLLGEEGGKELIEKINGFNEYALAAIYASMHTFNRRNFHVENIDMAKAEKWFSDNASNLITGYEHDSKGLVDQKSMRTSLAIDKEQFITYLKSL